ncbi:MAG TPA: PDZ domain-containing protein [Bryobacteraceae bacterium]|nr:PDZ domain-containing protein [Bryobacteraceae bacterium]
MIRYMWPLWAVLALAQESAILPQRPAFNGTDIVFSYAGDLWRVGKAGGAAARLTAGQGVETYPVFSPDGKMVAFTGEYDGNFDVYTVPVTGGTPKRITYHPGVDEPAAWTNDGKFIVFRSSRAATSARYRQLFRIPANGGPEEVLPFPFAVAGSFSPDESRIAYMPIGFFRPPHSYDSWKNYRGGKTTKIWVAQMSDSSVAEIPRDNSNDSDPLWIGQEVYFLSDREGPVTLFAYDTNTKKVRRVLENKAFDYRSASAGPGAIVLEKFGGIQLYDWKTKKLTDVRVTVDGDLREVRARWEKAGNTLRGFALSPTGKRAVFEARGEIVTVPAEKGDVRVLSNSPGAHDRSPAWSPDGESIAWFSDEGGSYALTIRNQSGLGEKRRIVMSENPGYYFDPVWSPDSKWIVCEDNRLNLLLVEVATGKVNTIATDYYYDPERTFNPAWSPDSQWIAYTKELPSHFHAAFAHSLQEGKSIQLTDGMSDVRYPAFDRSGLYLYFTASTNIGPTLGWIDMTSDPFSVNRSAYVMVLRKETASPLAAESDEETPKKEAPKEEKPVVRIDAEGLSQRILALPVPPRDYQGLEAGKAGIVFLHEAHDAGPGTVHRFDLKARKAAVFTDGVTSWTLSADGEKILIRKGAQWITASSATPPKPGEGNLNTAAIEVWVDPREEWKQMYGEAWRMQSEYFYDPKLHGVDAKAMSERYEKFVRGLGSRSDLNYLLTEMLGYITVGHLYVRGGEVPAGKPVPGGLLGADFEVAGGLYRIRKIYNGENWNPALRAPLTAPGVDVRTGDYLLSIDGRDVRADKELHSYLEGRANRQVRLRVSTDPAGANPRDAIVVPVASDTELRYFDWVEGNRRKVEQASAGKLAYVYMPDTGAGGYQNFVRYYFAQSGREGVIIDERFNGGGQAADYVIDVLRREPMNYWRTRYGHDTTTPVMGVTGPRVMITNEFAGSGGDAMPYYFRFHKVGTLVGTRTWGGLVGILGYPVLMDGGTLTAPNFAFRNMQGAFDVENKGVAPDVESWFDPAAARKGQDPQLDKAIGVALEQVSKQPARRPAEPVYPQYAK